MTDEEIRVKFRELFGEDKYKHFVLSIYQCYPWKNLDRLFYWQLDLLTEFASKHGIEPIGIENLRGIFTLCPVHNSELKVDTIPIVDGNKIIRNESYYNHEKEKFPMAYVNAPRDLERMTYPENIEKVYCEKCRNVKKEYNAK